MKVKSLRAVRIASTTGHVINIPANKATEIPERIAEEAFARGCVPCDDAGNINVGGSNEEQLAQAAADENERRAAVSKEADESEDASSEPETEAAALNDRLFAAFGQLTELGDEASFNKNTKAPKVGAVSDILGEKISAEVVDAAWGEFNKG